NGAPQPPQPLSRAIDLSQVGPNHKVILRLNATGIRNASSVSATIRTMAGATIINQPELFFDAHPDSWSRPESAGMDQVRIELPQSLWSSGPATVELNVGIKTSNAVEITFA